MEASHLGLGPDPGEPASVTGWHGARALPVRRPARTVRKGVRVCPDGVPTFQVPPAAGTAVCVLWRGTPCAFHTTGSTRSCAAVRPPQQKGRPGPAPRPASPVCPPSVASPVCPDPPVPPVSHVCAWFPGPPGPRSPPASRLAVRRLPGFPAPARRLPGVPDPGHPVSRGPWNPPVPRARSLRVPVSSTRHPVSRPLGTARVPGATGCGRSLGFSPTPPPHPSPDGWPPTATTRTTGIRQPVGPAGPPGSCDPTGPRRCRPPGRTLPLGHARTGRPVHR